jgi:hypothetical protein
MKWGRALRRRLFLLEVYMVKKLAEEQAKAEDEAEKAAEESGTATPVLEPEKSKMPEPGTTPDTEGILNTDQAKALSPNVTVSGTVPDGEGGQRLLDTVDPAVANAGILPPRQHQPPQNPSDPPEYQHRIPGPDEAVLECTADNRPFYTGGPMDKGERYVMRKEEADLLVKSKAGKIVDDASDENSRQEGTDV